MAFRAARMGGDLPGGGAQKGPPSKGRTFLRHGEVRESTYQPKGGRALVQTTEKAEHTAGQLFGEPSRVHGRKWPERKPGRDDLRVSYCRKPRDRPGQRTWSKSTSGIETSIKGRMSVVRGTFRRIGSKFPDIGESRLGKEVCLEDRRRGVNTQGADEEGNRGCHVSPMIGPVTQTAPVDKLTFARLQGQSRSTGHLSGPVCSA